MNHQFLLLESVLAVEIKFPIIFWPCPLPRVLEYDTLSV